MCRTISRVLLRTAVDEGICAHAAVPVCVVAAAEGVGVLHASRELHSSAVIAIRKRRSLFEFSLYLSPPVLAK